jgi:hypothetical protein
MEGTRPTGANSMVIYLMEQFGYRLIMKSEAGYVKDGRRRTNRRSSESGSAMKSWRIFGKLEICVRYDHCVA